MADKIYCYNCVKEIEVEGKCPYCGFDLNEGKYIIQPHQLKPGTVLRDRYLIGKVIGEGGFGITYVGRDDILGSKIAVKEFYMSGFVNRNNTCSSSICSETGEKGELFNRNKEKFYQEARTLAKFSTIEGIVHIRDFFNENDTSYIVMEYLDGKSLKDILYEKGKLSVEETMKISMPILKALEVVHKDNIIHRDISPDNIIITEDGKPWLIDFGAAREMSEDGMKSLSVILKHGYAPEEQYRRRGLQGPWTDIYAISATMYRCIAGKRPDDALERNVKDETAMLCEVDTSISKSLSDVIMRGLSIRSEDRFQSVVEMMDALEKANNNYSEEAREKNKENDKTEILTEILYKNEADYTPEKNIDVGKNGHYIEKKKKEIWPFISLGIFALIVILLIIVLTVNRASILKLIKSDSKNEGAKIISEGQDFGDNDDPLLSESLNNNDSEIIISNDKIDGDVIKFGKYEQDGDLSNGMEDIEWLILSVEDEKILLISKYALDCQPYNTERVDTTWETSSLRKWLNEYFYNTAFSESEKASIVSVVLTNEDNHLFETNGGNNTEDKLFCLSVDEVEKYFGEYKLYSEEEKWGFNDNLICSPTKYASEMLAHTNEITEEYYSSIDEKYTILAENELALKDFYPEDVIGKIGTWWWLRTPGNTSDRSCFVGSTGAGGTGYFYFVDRESTAVRPALYLEY